MQAPPASQAAGRFQPACLRISGLPLKVAPRSLPTPFAGMILSTQGASIPEWRFTGILLPRPCCVAAIRPASVLQSTRLAVETTSTFQPHTSMAEGAFLSCNYHPASLLLAPICSPHGRLAVTPHPPPPACPAHLRPSDDTH